MRSHGGSINYLETAHRNIAWFVDRHRDDELDMSPPFQRNPVWTDSQKSYLMDTILRGLPVPELYMQDVVDEDGNQQYVVVDGQQRIRSCLEFLENRFTLNDEESPEWGRITFDQLTPEDKKRFFGYKFVVRTLPELREDELRDIFARLNRNVVALNRQELRHATYWGPFIKTVEKEAEENPFWSDAGIFTAGAFRRMLDVEFVSELMIAYLHGLQHKKSKLDHYYQLYEQHFEASEEILTTFRRTTGEISSVLPDLKSHRWKKKSDFYTLFLILAQYHSKFPLSRDGRHALQSALIDFGHKVDEYLRIENEEEEEGFPNRVARYGKAVARAASDRPNRKVRQEVLEEVILEALGAEIRPE